MQDNYFEDKKFEKVNFTETLFTKGDYECCSFINCNFSNADLSGVHFIECEFSGCDLSMAKLNKTVFRDIHFKDCKLLGLHFETCDTFLFSAKFDNCIANLSSFFQLKLKKIKFTNTTFHEADFTEADLNGAVFENCDLKGAVFENTILEKTDFRTAFNYSFDPEKNKIKKAKFSISGIAGLLGKYDIEIM